MALFAPELFLGSDPEPVMMGGGLNPPLLVDRPRTTKLGAMANRSWSADTSMESGYRNASQRILALFATFGRNKPLYA